MFKTTSFADGAVLSESATRVVARTPMPTLNVGKSWTAKFAPEVGGIGRVNTGVSVLAGVVLWS